MLRYDAQVDRTYASAGGTIQALRLLFEEGRLMAGNIAGGTHHAFRDRSVGVSIQGQVSGGVDSGQVSGAVDSGTGKLV